MRVLIVVLGLVTLRATAIEIVCYRPAVDDLPDYLWTEGANWKSSTDPGYQTLNRAPTLDEDVLLYSSSTTNTPLRVAPGVHAETHGLSFGYQSLGANKPQRFRVDAGGTMTNAENVVLGNGDKTAVSAHVSLAGEWTTHGRITVGASKIAGSSFTIEEGGMLWNATPVPDADSDASEFIIGSANGSVENAVTNRGAMTLFDLHLGSGYALANGILENFGTLTIGRMFTIGRTGRGMVHLHRGGRIVKNALHDKPLYLPYASNANGAFVLDDDFTMDAADTFRMGYGQASVGELTLNDAVFTLANTNTFGEGYGSSSTITLNGASRLACVSTNGVACDLALGRNYSATVHLTLRGRSTIDGAADLNMAAFDWSRAVVEVLDSAAITNIASQRITMARRLNATARLIVGGDAIVAGVTNIMVAPSYENSFGGIELHGGTLAFNRFAGNSGNYTALTIGGWPSCTTGELMGWGRCACTDSSNVRACVVVRGRVVADGGGEPHDLDMAVFRQVGRTDPESVNTCGTNGWYAVNKGRLIYPRIMDRSSANKIVGDHTNRNEPTLVNSFKLVFEQWPTGYPYAFTELYAADRDDIPAGLPSMKGVSVRGVWRIGFSSAYGDVPTPVAFVGFKPDFRYDGEGLTEKHRVTLYHHDGTSTGAWQCIAASVPFDPESVRIAAEKAVEPSSTAWNAGWFAVVAYKAGGLAVILR